MPSRRPPAENRAWIKGRHAAEKHFLRVLEMSLMGYGCANMLRIGDKVTICSYEGFGGTGIIVDTRTGVDSNYKVRMTSQPKDFWAWNEEIEEISINGFTRNKLSVLYVIRDLLREIKYDN